MVFVKGQSGNPKGGAIAQFSLLRMLKDKLKQIPEGEKEMVASRVLDSYIKHLKEGKPELLKDVLDRVDGKPKSAEDDLGSKGNPVNIQITVKRL